VLDHEQGPVRCRLVGDYVDDAELPADLRSHAGEVVRPKLVAQYLDDRYEDEEREFKVLLHDKSLVTVQGRCLKYLQNPSSTTDLGSYAVLSQFRGQEVIVALFPVSEVTGVFRGKLE
jgi:hypothetical protein